MSDKYNEDHIGEMNSSLSQRNRKILKALMIFYIPIIFPAYILIISNIWSLTASAFGKDLALKIISILCLLCFSMYAIYEKETMFFSKDKKEHFREKIKKTFLNVIEIFKNKSIKSKIITVFMLCLFPVSLFVVDLFFRHSNEFHFFFNSYFWVYLLIPLIPSIFYFFSLYLNENHKTTKITVFQISNIFSALIALFISLSSLMTILATMSECSLNFDHDTSDCSLYNMPSLYIFLILIFFVFSYIFNFKKASSLESLENKRYQSKIMENASCLIVAYINFIFLWKPMMMSA